MRNYESYLPLAHVRVYSCSHPTAVRVAAKDRRLPSLGWVAPTVRARVPGCACSRVDPDGVRVSSALGG